MRYELANNADVGVVIDSTPILRDIKDTFTVSFVLPEPGAYVALFRDESGVEYRATIKDGTTKVPKQLLTKEQRVGLTVCRISDEAVLRSWECATLKVGTFLSLRQTQWQITVGTDDKKLYARLAEIERIHAMTQTEFEMLKTKFEILKDDYAHQQVDTAQSVNSFMLRLNEQEKMIVSVTKENETLTATYNKAIEVINKLSERLTALEQNYDPTVIE